MIARKPPPIGPLALALRHRRGRRSPIGWIAAALGLALVIGVGLLVLN